MKTAFIAKIAGLFTCLLLAASVAFCQESPRETASGTVNGAQIKINYGSPAVKGRKIWGDLVPYNAIWRTGANEATTFETSKDVNIGGKLLHAGKYSVFTVPGEKEWKVIFNSETTQWGIKDDGSANDDPSKDVLTVIVKPEKAKEFKERLTFVVADKGFSLLWENLAVPVSIN